MGHRFLGSRIELTEPANYEKEMLEQYVIVDPQKRKKQFLSQLKELEEEKNWVILVDEDLLEEVNNLVEYPTVFIWAI